MTDASRDRLAALLVTAGVGIAIFSIVAEGIGLGSGNGTFGTWQKTGLVIGFIVIVGGSALYSTLLGFIVAGCAVYSLSFKLEDIVRAPALSWWHSAICGALLMFLIWVAPIAKSTDDGAEGRTSWRNSENRRLRPWAMAAAILVLAAWSTAALNGPICPDCPDPYRAADGCRNKPIVEFDDLACEL